MELFRGFFTYVGDERYEVVKDDWRMRWKVTKQNTLDRTIIRS
jgi:hypothetical protein